MRNTNYTTKLHVIYLTGSEIKTLPIFNATINIPFLVQECRYTEQKKIIEKFDVLFISMSSMLLPGIRGNDARSLRKYHKLPHCA